MHSIYIRVSRMSRASPVRHRHHLHPLAPGEGDIAVLLELQQSLPHRGSADAQLLADVVLGVDGPYPKPVEEDRLLDQAVCLFFIRGRGPHILSAKQLLCHKLSSRPMPAFPHLTIPGRPVSSGATYLLPGQRGLSGSRLPRRGGRCCPPLCHSIWYSSRPVFSSRSAARMAKPSRW